MTPIERETIRQEIEAEIQMLEDVLIPDARKSLAYLTNPDYDPAENADDELREDDIEFLEVELRGYSRDLGALKKRLKRYPAYRSKPRNPCGCG